MAIEIGSVVEFKSGSPKMTVIEVDRTDPVRQYAACVWFVEGKQQGGTFPIQSLKESE
jgi:uncharacterized protein YodC (DUF2158 family)